MPDVMADDAMVNSTGYYNRFVSPYQYSITPSSTYSVDPWIGCYSLIDNCNAILDNLETLPESSERNRIEAVKRRITPGLSGYLLTGFAYILIK